jgi:site-specific DNA-methyltransferase (adenine-specific)
MRGRQKMETVKVLDGDCLEHLKNMSDGYFDLIYLDPPFFTQKIQSLSTRKGDRSFLFSDLWDSHREYADFLYERLLELHRLLRETGSLFFHCDRNASHIARILLDQIFGEKMFQSEIIWHYRRWSNSKKGLLPAHQKIFFYSKTKDFKFYRKMTDYSPTTNIDQIIQRRSRDQRGKTIYARDEYGNVITNGAKKGVPLSDVWEIPYLNPKARERAGYPTQKPILLLEKIIELVTDEGDIVLDPFCGSGTTLIAAQLLGRRAIGIDISLEAIELTKERLKEKIKSESRLLEKGKDSYINSSSKIGQYLFGIDFVTVHRNNGIDAILKEEFDRKLVFVRIQRDGETLAEAISAMKKAVKNKGDSILVVIVTEERLIEQYTMQDVIIINSIRLSMTKGLKDFMGREKIGNTNNKIKDNVSSFSNECLQLEFL